MALGKDTITVGIEAVLYSQKAMQQFQKMAEQVQRMFSKQLPILEQQEIRLLSLTKQRRDLVKSIAGINQYIAEGNKLSKTGNENYGLMATELHTVEKELIAVKRAHKELTTQMEKDFRKISGQKRTPGYVSPLLDPTYQATRGRQLGIIDKKQIRANEIIAEIGKVDAAILKQINLLNRVKVEANKPKYQKTITELQAYKTKLQSVQTELNQTTTATKRYTQAKERASEATIRLGGATHGLMRVFSRMRNQLLVLTFAVSGLIFYLRSAITNIVAMESAYLGLDSVARKLNTGVSQTRAVAKSLSDDGLLPVTDAVNALKNLLATGFNLEQATNLMYAFKDAAAFNRQGTLSMGEAVVGAAQGLKNQNCLKFNTLIFDYKSGTLKTIQELHDSGEVPVVTAVNRKTGKLQVIQASYIHYNGEADVYKVELENGKFIEATENHRFITKRGMVFLNELEDGEEVLYLDQQELEKEWLKSNVKLAEKSLKQKTKNQDSAATPAKINGKRKKDQNPQIKKSQKNVKFANEDLQSNSIGKTLLNIAVGNVIINQKKEKNLHLIEESTSPVYNVDDSLKLNITEKILPNFAVLNVQPNIEEDIKKLNVFNVENAFWSNLAVQSKLSSVLGNAKVYGEPETLSEEMQHIIQKGDIASLLKQNAISAEKLLIQIEQLSNVELEKLAQKSVYLNSTKETLHSSLQVKTAYLLKKLLHGTEEETPVIDCQEQKTIESGENLSLYKIPFDVYDVVENLKELLRLIIYYGGDIGKTTGLIPETALPCVKSATLGFIAMCQEVLMNQKNITPTWVKIVKISYSGTESVYDLTVPEEHNFLGNSIFTSNSIMVDNAGITKNLSVILKEAGYSMADLGKITSDVNVRMAIYQGILKEASLFQGDAAKAANSLNGALSRIGVGGKELSATVGKTLTPTILQFSEAFTTAVERTKQFVSENNKLISSRIQEYYTGTTAVINALRIALESLLKVFILIPPKLVFMTLLLILLYKQVQNLAIALSLVYGTSVKWTFLIKAIGTMRIAVLALIGTFVKLYTIMKSITVIGFAGAIRGMVAAIIALGATGGFLVVAITAIIAVLVTLALSYESAEKKARRLNEEKLRMIEQSSLVIDNLIAEYEQMEANFTISSQQLDILIQLREEREKMKVEKEAEDLKSMFFTLQDIEKQLLKIDKSRPIIFKGKSSEEIKAMNLEKELDYLAIDIQNKMAEKAKGTNIEVEKQIELMRQLESQLKTIIAMVQKEELPKNDSIFFAPTRTRQIENEKLLTQHEELLSFFQNITQATKELTEAEKQQQSQMKQFLTQEPLKKATPFIYPTSVPTEEQAKEIEDNTKKANEAIKELTNSNIKLEAEKLHLSDAERQYNLQLAEANIKLAEYKQLQLDVAGIDTELSRTLNKLVENYEKLTTEKLKQAKAEIELKKISDENTRQIKLDNDRLDFNDKVIKQNLELNSQYQEMLTGVQDLSVVERQHAEQIRILTEEGTKLGIVNTQYIKDMERTLALLREQMKLEQERQTTQKYGRIAVEAGVISKGYVGEKRDRTMTYETGRYDLEIEKNAKLLELQNQFQDFSALGWATYFQRLEDLNIIYTDKELELERAKWEAKWHFMETYLSGMQEFNSTIIQMTNQTTLKQLQPFKILAKAAENAFKSMLVSYLTMLSQQAAADAALHFAKAKGYAAAAAILALNPLTMAEAPYFASKASAEYAAAATQAGYAVAYGAGAGIANSAFASGATGGASGGGGGDGGISGGGSTGTTINGTVQARELKITIAPVLTISAEGDILIGSGSVTEFSYIAENQIVSTIKDAIETGQINLNSYGA